MTSLVQLLKLLLSQASSSDQRDLAAQAAEASSLHAKAWGRKWPDTFQGTICLSDLQPRPTTTTKGKAVTQAVESVEPINEHHEDEHYEEEDIVEDILSVQHDTLTYDYMKGMKEVAYYLGALSWVEDCLVIREDYPYLLKELEKLSGRTQAVAILCQSGNGKTVLLLYILLYRLERRLPTAIQLSPDVYFIFDEQGVTAHSARARSFNSPRLRRCWALSDSNHAVQQPCLDFQITAALVVQASSPRTDRWDGWLRDRSGVRLVMELPTVLEIGAIIKELGYDTSSTLEHVETWGPSIRTVMELSQGKATHSVALAKAELAAAKVSRALAGLGPQSILVDDVVTHEAYSLVFLRPHYNDQGERCQYPEVFIPTKHLANILLKHIKSVENARSLKLFKLLRSHPHTRSFAGWYLD